MPSQSNPGALLALGTVNEDSEPWVWDSWQARTGLHKAPWYSEGVFEADEAKLVLAFVTAYHDPIHTDKIEFMRKKDEWNEGKRLWNNWVNGQWEKVRVLMPLIISLSLCKLLINWTMQRFGG